ncbi:hypothetical protein PACTADRAFT_51941 [Pachysolen tannophilus NRRL Y-2460]|uniref:DUF3533 domain-containing protein n=1 Tax=Pachysolen tannophilus NRRL Y-2460 TaxID=669874 RepID=A0A1E4TNK2_PACTA|nr:hypothetical protein PACTADRAFT_51941 [Pachysolen tannophilus NRRL Y-2460]
MTQNSSDGDESSYVEAYRADEFDPNFVERQASNQFVGGDEISSAYESDSEESNGDEHFENEKIKDIKTGLASQNGVEPEVRAEGEPVREAVREPLHEPLREPVREPVHDGNSSLSRTASRISNFSQKIKQKFGFFDKGFKGDRIVLAFSFIKIYVIMATLILGIFSIYWGSIYRRQDRYPNLKMLVVIEDQEVDGIAPYLGQAIEKTANSSTMVALGTWHVKTEDEMTALASKDGLSVYEETTRLVHHQKYWSAVYVRPNATYDIYSAFKNANSSYSPSSEMFVEMIYETGRDFAAVSEYIYPFLLIFQQTFISNITENFYSPLLQELSDDEKTSLILDAPNLLNEIPYVDFYDMRPANNQVVLAPSQVGLIYLIILTFFQFNFFLQVHGKIAQKLRTLHYVVYRALAAQVSYLILSLAYSAVSAAFQINFNNAYKGGFGVQWMFSYLTMAAVGGANENVALICFATYPPVLGFWLLGFVIINISPTFAPLALCPHFYRYGYAFPIHNSAEATKVVLFNTYRGQLGRNIGILIAWIVINNSLLPFTLKFFASRMRKKALAASSHGGSSPKQLSNATPKK